MQLISQFVTDSCVFYSVVVLQTIYYFRDTIIHHLLPSPSPLWLWACADADQVHVGINHYSLINYYVLLGESFYLLKIWKNVLTLQLLLNFFMLCKNLLQLLLAQLVGTTLLRACPWGWSGIQTNVCNLGIRPHTNAMMIQYWYTWYWGRFGIPRLDTPPVLSFDSVPVWCSVPSTGQHAWIWQTLVQTLVVAHLYHIA